jgi:hypothetical protein
MRLAAAQSTVQNVSTNATVRNAWDAATSSGTALAPQEHAFPIIRDAPQTKAAVQGYARTTHANASKAERTAKFQLNAALRIAFCLKTQAASAWANADMAAAISIAQNA